MKPLLYHSLQLLVSIYLLLSRSRALNVKETTIASCRRAEQQQQQQQHPPLSTITSSPTTPRVCHHFKSASQQLDDPVSCLSSSSSLHVSRRRSLFRGFFKKTALLVVAASFTMTHPTPCRADVFGLFAPKERRQLEFCLVAVLRVLYWAQGVADSLQKEDDAAVKVEQQQQQQQERRKQAYLEARLGAKALLTQKVGGGASYPVYTLATLQLPECLQDLEYYYNSNNKNKKSSTVVADLRRDWSESLAALVEFDGMDSLTDPSPRSSLTLTQYNNDKAVFVKRMLSERVVPIGQQLLQQFDADAVQRSRAYVQQYYESEIPNSGKSAEKETKQ